MKNPFELSLEGKADLQPVVVLDEVRNALIAHLRLDACEACVPGYGALSPRVYALEEDRIALMGQLQSLYEGINAYTERALKLMKEEQTLLCKPCWQRLIYLSEVVTFVQECDLQSPLKPFTALLTEEKDDENAETPVRRPVMGLVSSEDAAGGRKNCGAS